MTHRGGMRSGTLKSPPGGLCGNVRVHPTLLGTQKKGGPSILLEFHTEVQKKLGPDKAHSCFTHISHSTLWNLGKFSIHRNLHS